MAAVNHERVSVLVQRDDVETILQAGLVIDGGDDPGGSSDFDVTSSRRGRRRVIDSHRQHASTMKLGDPPQRMLADT
jgi:hypothetical protein